MDKTTNRLMMASQPPRLTNVQLVGATNGGFSAGVTTYTMSKPAGVEVGDLVMLFILRRSNLSFGTNSSFTQQLDQVVTTGGTQPSRIGVFSRTATAFEPTDYVFNIGSSPDVGVGICAVFRGGVFDAVGSAAAGSQGSSSAVSVPGAVATQPFALNLAFIGAASMSGVGTNSLFTLVNSRLGGTSGGGALFSRSLPTSGDTTTRSFSMTGTGSLATGGVQCVIREA